ncbi:hypothetical protein H6F67_19295 [Microcoleus sp. FACHB-1515]|uniref:hypothetical protein n=1 Tax=Cyanophyceae TaxID=3028117 RepID=UPI0016834CB0|nr:hypothetical protein [Microcoleus sp. FACHB-1515]MBD2091996.1 hypothetical protein [Microcoleus sp. FACHB-1515]
MAIAFLAVANILLIYGVLIQMIFASKNRNPLVWALGALIVAAGVPPTILSLLSWLPQRTGGAIFATAWTFFGYPLWNYNDRSHLLFAALGVVLQLVLLAGLLLKFRQTLRCLKVSASQPIETNY